MEQYPTTQPRLTKLGRRSFIGGTIAASFAATALGQTRDYGQNAAPVRYPDRDVVVLDPRFAKYKVGNAAIQRAYTGMAWAEGPAWNGVGRYLVWSDIPNNIQHRWLAEDNHVSVFRNPANNSNGNTFDFEGRQLSCEHGMRRVVRYEYNGSVTVLADKWQGNHSMLPTYRGPSDGGVWLLIPDGSMNASGEGVINKGCLSFGYKTGKLDWLLANSKNQTVSASQDYKKLCVIRVRPGSITSWDVSGTTPKHKCLLMNLKTQNGELVGGTDGVRVDIDGIWASAGWAGDGLALHIFAQMNSSDIRYKTASNICFGAQENRLLLPRVNHSTRYL